jgi:hypothetical protein
VLEKSGWYAYFKAQYQMQISARFLSVVLNAASLTRVVFELLHARYEAAS